MFRDIADSILQPPQPPVSTNDVKLAGLVQYLTGPLCDYIDTLARDGSSVSAAGARILVGKDGSLRPSLPRLASSIDDISAVSSRLVLQAARMRLVDMDDSSSNERIHDLVATLAANVVFVADAIRPGASADFVLTDLLTTLLLLVKGKKVYDEAAKMKAVVAELDAVDKKLATQSAAMKKVWSEGVSGVRAVNFDLPNITDDMSVQQLKEAYTNEVMVFTKACGGVFSQLEKNITSALDEKAKLLSSTVKTSRIRYDSQRKERELEVAALGLTTVEANLKSLSLAKWRMIAAGKVPMPVAEDDDDESSTESSPSRRKSTEVAAASRGMYRGQILHALAEVPSLRWMPDEQKPLVDKFLQHESSRVYKMHLALRSLKWGHHSAKWELFLGTEPKADTDAYYTAIRRYLGTSGMGIPLSLQREAIELQITDWAERSSTYMVSSSFRSMVAEIVRIAIKGNRLGVGGTEMCIAKTIYNLGARFYMDFHKRNRHLSLLEYLLEASSCEEVASSTAVPHSIANLTVHTTLATALTGVALHDETKELKARMVATTDALRKAEEKIKAFELRQQNYNNTSKAVHEPTDPDSNATGGKGSWRGTWHRKPRGRGRGGPRDEDSGAGYRDASHASRVKLDVMLPVSVAEGILALPVDTSKACWLDGSEVPGEIVYHASADLLHCGVVDEESCPIVIVDSGADLAVIPASFDRFVVERRYQKRRFIMADSDTSFESLEHVVLALPVWDIDGTRRLARVAGAYVPQSKSKNMLLSSPSVFLNHPKMEDRSFVCLFEGDELFKAVVDFSGDESDMTGKLSWQLRVDWSADEASVCRVSRAVEMPLAVKKRLGLSSALQGVDQWTALHRRMYHQGEAKLRAAAKLSGWDPSIPAEWSAVNQECTFCHFRNAKYKTPGSRKVNVESRMAAIVEEDEELLMDTDAVIEDVAQGLVFDLGSWNPTESSVVHSSGKELFSYLGVAVETGTGFMHVMPLRTKAEMPGFVLSVITKRRGHVFYVQGDYALEHKSDEFRALLLQLGVEWRLSAPHSPQSQGLAESSFGRLRRMVESIAVETGLAYAAWPVLVSMAAEVINRSPGRGGGLSPCTKVLGMKNPLSLMPGDTVVASRASNLNGKGAERALGQYLFLTSKGIAVIGTLNAQGTGFFTRRYREDNLRVIIQSKEDLMRKRFYDVDRMAAEAIVTAEVNEASLDFLMPPAPLPARFIIPPALAEYSDGTIPANNTLFNNAFHVLEPLVTQETDQVIISKLRELTKGRCTNLLNALEYELSSEQVRDPFTFSIKQASLSSVKGNKDMVTQGVFQDSDQRELDKFLKYNVWEPTNTLPPTSHPLRTMWVRVLKDGKAKSRLVILGNQDTRIVPTAVGLPGADWRRLIHIIGLSLNLIPACADVTSAFLQAPITTDVYISLPAEARRLKQLEGFKYARLRQAMYGLADSPLLFVHYMQSVMTKLGYVTVADGVFHHTDQIWVLIYVDDILVYAKNPLEVLNNLSKLIDICDIKLVSTVTNPFIGVNVEYLNGVIHLDMEHYKEELEVEFSRPVSGYALKQLQDRTQSDVINPSIIKKVQQALGKLGWFAHHNPQVLFRFSFLSQFVDRGEHTLAIVEKALGECLKVNTRHRYHAVLCPEIRIFTDASYNLATRSAREGYIVFIHDASMELELNMNMDFGNYIDARARRARKLLLSVQHAELDAIGWAMRSLSPLLESLRMMNWKTKLYCDNEVVVNLLNGSFKASEELLRAESELWSSYGTYFNVSFHHVSTKHQRADMLTKLFHII